MTEGFYFQIPSLVAMKIMLRSGVMFATIVLVLTLTFGNRFIDTAFFLVLCHIGLYFVLRHYKYVFISQNGILGSSTSGKRISISWEDKIEIRKTSAFGIPGYGIRKNGFNSIFVPEAIFTSTQFLTVVGRFAPNNHALLAQAK